MEVEKGLKILNFTSKYLYNNSSFRHFENPFYTCCQFPVGISYLRNVRKPDGKLFYWEAGNFFLTLLEIYTYMETSPAEIYRSRPAPNSCLLEYHSKKLNCIFLGKLPSKSVHQQLVTMTTFQRSSKATPIQQMFTALVS